MKYPFLFSSSERRGLYMLAILCFLFIGAKFYFFSPQSTRLENAVSVRDSIQSPILKKEWKKKNFYSKDTTYVKSKWTKENKKEFNKSRYFPENDNLLVELNAADKEQLIALNGIGESYASRILKYRELVGGFVSKEQLLQVYGLDSVLFDKIKNHVIVDLSLVKKHNVNKESVEELGQFKRIGYKRAKVIVAYREQHGDYNSLKDLLKTRVINDSILYLIEPYIVLNDIREN